MTPHLVIVGTPEGNRVAGLCSAASSLGWPPPDIVSWADLLSGRHSLLEMLRPDSIVRIESPGRDFDVERLILAEGADTPEEQDLTPAFLDRDTALSLEFDRGLIVCPRQWYRGFRSWLRRLDQEYPGVRWMNHPADIEVMFDKRICQRIFDEAGIPIPFNLGPIRDFEQLRERMNETDQRRVFVKLAHGSTASGVVALARYRDRFVARTTVEMVRGADQVRMYNSRRLRVYESHRDVSLLIDTLAREGVQVEAWVPKAVIGGRNFDLRVVVIDDQACHIVTRLSHDPMTNLHLLNDRGDVALAQQVTPSDAWDAAMSSCTRALACFPRSFYAGVDVAFMPSPHRHAVLEINAFGDLLNNVFWQGRDPYTAELEALSRSLTCE